MRRRRQRLRCFRGDGIPGARRPARGGGRVRRDGGADAGRRARRTALRAARRAARPRALAAADAAPRRDRDLRRRRRRDARLAADGRDLRSILSAPRSSPSSGPSTTSSTCTRREARRAGRRGADLPVDARGQVTDFTLPFVDRVDLGDLGGAADDRRDGADHERRQLLRRRRRPRRRASARSRRASFAVIAFDLGRGDAGVLAAIIAGAALGFLVHNFHPASVFMGDCGSNLLGCCSACVIVEGSLKTNAVDRAHLPARDPRRAVPRHDFVVAQAREVPPPGVPRRPLALPPPHRRTSASPSGGRCSTCTPGCSRWRAWPSRCASSRTRTTTGTSTSAGRSSWPSCSSSGLAASVYLVYVLEILKFRRLDTIRLRRVRPDTTDAEIDADVEERLATGEFESVRRETEDFPSV